MASIVARCTYPLSFGYQTFNDAKKFVDDLPDDPTILSRKTKSFEKAKIVVMTKNILNVVGYIPIISTILGIVRITAATWALHQINNNKRFAEGFGALAKPFLEGQRVRSVFEILSLGFLLVIPDLIISFNR